MPIYKCPLFCILSNASEVDERDNIRVKRICFRDEAAEKSAKNYICTQKARLHGE
jgi:hypothetical protein